MSGAIGRRGRRTHRASWVWGALVLASLCGCKSKPPPPERKTEPNVVGGNCREETLSRTCSFGGIWTVDPNLPSDGESPGRWVEPPKEPDAIVMYEIAYSFPDRCCSGSTLRVEAKGSDLAELKRFYASHADVPCVAQVIRPPCPPSQSTTLLELPPPPVGRLVR